MSKLTSLTSNRARNTECWIVAVSLLNFLQLFDSGLASPVRYVNNLFRVANSFRLVSIGFDPFTKRVINFKFPLQPHQKYHITRYDHSLLRWTMIILPILPTSLIHFSLEGWENVLFELGAERVNQNDKPAPYSTKMHWRYGRYSLTERGITELPIGLVDSTNCFRTNCKMTKHNIDTFQNFELER